MNKVDFLRKLDRELSVLSKEERRELLAFYEERFYTGTIYENKTEEQVIAELESPEAIAKNILEEFGVSKKYVKNEQERYSNVSLAQVIFLLSFDVLIATWMIPTLFSAAISILGSTFSYIGVLGLLAGTPSTADEFMFAFLTGAYILLFLFGLVVFEAFLWVSKKVIIWHLNVFKIRGREKWLKSLSKWSIDGWFKRHRLAKIVKNWALVGALVVITYTGFWLFNNYDNIAASYQAEAETETYTQDFTAEIANGDEWTIEADLETMSLEIVLVSGNEFKVYRSSTDSEDVFTNEFDMENNVLTIINDSEDFKFTWKIEDIFRLINNKNLVRVEVPENVVIHVIDADTGTGTVTITNVDADILTIVVGTGSINLDNIVVDGNVLLTSGTGSIVARNIEAGELHRLKAHTGTGTVTINTANFDEYDFYTGTGSIKLTDLNVTSKNATTITTETGTGSIRMDNVYVLNIDLETGTGSIYFYNDDETFLPESFSKDTGTGSIETNVR